MVSIVLSHQSSNFTTYFTCETCHGATNDSFPVSSMTIFICLEEKFSVLILSVIYYYGYSVVEGEVNSVGFQQEKELRDI